MALSKGVVQSTQETKRGGLVGIHEQQGKSVEEGFRRTNNPNTTAIHRK